MRVNIGRRDSQQRVEAQKSSDWLLGHEGQDTSRPSSPHPVQAGLAIRNSIHNLAIANEKSQTLGIPSCLAWCHCKFPEGSFVIARFPYKGFDYRRCDCAVLGTS